MTYTPGKWILFHKRNLIEIKSSGETPIVHWLGFDDSDRSIAEHLANARLISAAPELLETCKNLIETIEGYVNNPTERLEVAKSIIKKATGSSNGR